MRFSARLAAGKARQSRGVMRPNNRTACTVNR
jgi:hypothetical protein